jgi:hypothetical protein
MYGPYLIRQECRKSIKAQKFKPMTLFILFSVSNSKKAYMSRNATRIILVSEGASNDPTGPLNARRQSLDTHTEATPAHAEKMQIPNSVHLLRMWVL